MCLSEWCCEGGEGGEGGESGWYNTSSNKGAVAINEQKTKGSERLCES